MELVKELTGWVDKARMTVSGHRGDDARDAHRPRLHRARQDREVRGPVPRRPRLRADQRLAGRHVRARRPGRPGPPDLGPRHPRRGRRHDHPGSLQQHRRAAPAVRAPGRGDRRDHRRARAGQRAGHPAQARLPPGDARPDRGVRDPADLRRGQDRLPLRPRRSRRVLRDQARPRHVRQGDGQRLPGRGIRWTRGGHERPAGQGQPRRHVRRATGSRRPPPSRRSRSCATRTRSRPSTPPGDASRPGCARSSTRPGCPTSSPATRACSGSCSPTRSRPSTATGRTTDHELYDAIAIGMHARGAMPEPDSREPWFICEAHAQGDIVDRIADDLLRLARRGPRGARPRWRSVTCAGGARQCREPAAG